MINDIGPRLKKCNVSEMDIVASEIRFLELILIHPTIIFSNHNLILRKRKEIKNALFYVGAEVSI